MAIQQKGSFILVFLLVEFIALLNGFSVRAQVTQSQMAVKKNNFSSFTRKQTDRGQLWMAKNKAYRLHPDANFKDQYIPNNQAVELFEKRTIDTKFFINKDSPAICYSQQSSGPMHFKKNGQWITIDTRLSPKGPFRYEASNQEDPLGFDIQRKSSYISTPDGSTYFNNWKLYGKNGDTETLLAAADWTHYTAGDDGIAFKNIFPGIDAEMKVTRGTIETNFIVHANPFPTYKTLLFRDSFLSSHAGHFTFSNGLSGNGLAASAEFRLSAKTVFFIKEGVMYQDKNPTSTYQFIPYYLDHNKLTLVINSDFLNARLRMGDVIIDPLVQDMGILKQEKIKGSHSNPDCNLNTACEYNLNVPAPPAATIIDALFSFGFTANAPCIGQNAAFSFAVNAGCTSQVWAGTTPGTGSQFFTTQSMLLNNGGSLAGCFPTPTCDHPTNIPFTFNFYRKCNGPDGCDGSCIGAAEDLTITLVGRTFDSASLTASPQTSCVGAPVTLTARGFYGVPPYNFTWVGLPQYNGDSVIVVSPNTDVIFRVQIGGSCPGLNSLPITASTEVIINAPVSPTVKISSSATTICTGAQVSFTATVSNGGNSPSYQWLLNNKKTGTNSPTYSSSSFANNDAVSCVVSASGPCAGSPGTSNVIVLTVNAAAAPTFNAIGPFCQNSTAPALPLKSKEGIPGTWSPASINTTTAGRTLYNFTPSSGSCVLPSQIAIVVNPLPTLTMGPDLTIATGASTELNVSVTGNILSYKWKPSIGLNDPTIKDPVASPSSTTLYTLDIVDDHGCEASGSIKINVSGSGSGGSSKILVPNAFSPNGDGINDTWVITNLSAYPGATVDVFNRYGQVVFHSDNVNKNWDGTFNGSPLPMGTYYYIIDPKNNEGKIAGSVTLFK
jgi:gliding motility-associated-like protein